MKSINVKKLAALTVGALFMGATAAHAAIAKDTLPTDKNWYTQAAIVIGSDSKPIDGVWAGNIAATIAQMAYTEETKTASADTANVKVQLSVPGEIVMPATGKTEMKNAQLDPTVTAGEIDTGSEVTVTHTYVPDLMESEELTYKYGPADSLQDGTAYATERLHLDYANAVGYTYNNEFELKAYTNAGKFYYEVTLTGLSLTSGTTYSEDATGTSPAIKNLYIPILGKKYKVTVITPVTGAGGSITLVGYSDEVDLEVGQTAQIPGTEYTVKLLDIDSDNSKAYLQLLDGQGNVIASDVVPEGSETDFGGILSTPVKVDAVFSGTQNNFAKLYLSSEKITLNEGDTKEDFAGSGWDLVAKTIDPNTITFEVVYNGDDDQTYLTAEAGLSPSDSMTIPNTRYGFMFGGFEAKPMQDVMFDGTAKKVTAMDARGVTNDFTLYAVKQLSFAQVTGTDDQEAIVTISDIVGGKDLKIKVVKDTDNTTDAETFSKILYDKDAYWATGEDWTSPDIETVYLYDNNGTADLVNTNFTAIRLDLDNDGKYDVLFAVTADNPQNPSKIYIYYGGYKVLDGATPITAVSEVNTTSVVSSWTADITAGVSTDVKYEIGANVNNTTPEFVGWYVKDGGNNVVAIPAYTVYDDTGNVGDSQVELKTPINLDKEYVDVAGVFKVDTDADSDTYPTSAYTDFGTYVEAESSSKVKVEVPVEQRQLQFFVGEVPETVQTTGTIEAGVGETVTIGDMQVKIEGITGVPSVTYTEIKPVPIGTIVYLDSDLPNTYDKVIVVGSGYVNSIAKMLEDAGVVEKVQAAGDKVLKMVTYNGKEYIAVWGYTGTDTAEAAQEFINFLKNNVA